MREEVKKAVETYLSKKAEKESEAKQMQVSDYLRAIGLSSKGATGVGDWKPSRTEEYCHEVNGVFYKEVKIPIELSDEEIKELYAIIPPEEVLKPKKEEVSESSSGRGLRTWGAVLMVLSIIAILVYVIMGIVEDGEYFIYAGAILLYFLPLSCFYKTVANIADAVDK